MASDQSYADYDERNEGRKKKKERKWREINCFINIIIGYLIVEFTFVVLLKLLNYETIIEKVQKKF